MSEVDNILDDTAISIENGSGSVTTGIERTTVATPHVTENENDNMPMTDEQKYAHYKKVCKDMGYKPPIPFKKFDAMGFPYTSTFDAQELKRGCRFLGSMELSSIPRRLDKPICRPGPLLKTELYHWYLADSIVQRIELKCDPNPNFVVRWVGYEDDFNTVEPLNFVKHTAVYALFMNPEKYTACRSNNSCIRRLRTKKACGTQALPYQLIVGITPTKYERAMDRLVNMLKIEESNGRYCPEIGFISEKSVADALKMEREFIVKKYIPFIKELNAPLAIDKHYAGCLGGNLQKAKQLKEAKSWCSNNASCIKSFIYNGIRDASKTSSNGPHYVCFFVPLKRGYNEKISKKQLSLHMCVYAIRSDGVKDAIFYNPAPSCFKQDLPRVLDEMVDPVIQTVTHKFGEASEKDDCVFQCMAFIIGLATGQIKFEPDLSQSARKYGNFPLKK